MKETDQDYLDCLRSLGYAYHLKKQYEEALWCFQKVAVLSKEIYGDKNIKAFNAYNNLAIALKMLGQKEEAMQIDAEVLEKRKELLGPDHPDTLLSAYNFMRDLILAERFAEAVELGREVWKKRRMILGEKHPLTLMTLRQLSSAMKKAGLRDEEVERATPKKKSFGSKNLNSKYKKD